MQSVEWKAETRDAGMIRTIIRRAGGLLARSVTQRDTYFRVIDGTLLKRQTEDEAPEYIHYLRPNAVTPRHTRFTLYTQEQANERFGERPLPEWVRVEKQREVWILNGLRVHIDDVRGLGVFVELEMLVTPARSLSDCERSIAQTRALLGPFVSEPVAKGYAELLALEHETSEDAA